MRINLVLFCVFLSAASSLAFAQKSQVTEIGDLDGMAGCWERADKAKGMLFTEMWMKPAGTSIFGVGRTVKNGKTVDYEFMRIEQRPDGIFFIAKPKANEAETEFKLKSSTLNEVVFENPEHDFPQRVIYKLSGKTLTGRIEGTHNGKTSAIDFPFDRVSCT